MSKEPRPTTGARLAFGARIRKAREELGMSQNDLARVLGKTPGSISFWEQGRGGPSYETLQELPSALGKSLEWLVSGKEETDTRAVTSPERKVIKTMKRMNPSQQEMLASMVDGVSPTPSRKRRTM